MSEKLFVSLGEAATARLERARAEFTTFDKLEAKITAGKQIVLVGVDLESTEAKAWEIVGQGISSSRIGFVVIDGEAPLGKPRHLFWRDAQPMRAAPDADEFPSYPSGVDFLDINLKWRWRLRELGIIAGPYSSGKSTVIQQLAYNFVRVNGEALGNSGALICAWEDEASEMKDNLARFIYNLDGCIGGEHDYLLDKIHYVCRDPNEKRLVPWYMELVKFYYERYGTRFFSLDPWNELDHVKDVRQIETEYIRDAMVSFRRQVDSLRIIQLIATHVPARMIRGDGSIEPFKIAHSFGSGNFGNKADRGLCVVRTKQFEDENGHAVLRLDKAKVEGKMGKRGTVAARFDWRRFSLDYDGYVTEKVKDVWKD